MIQMIQMIDPSVAYETARWTSFFSTEASASAALTGLLFVAVSINITEIIANRLLTARAIKALLTVVGVLLAATLCLVPAQPHSVLGIELTVLGALIWIGISFAEHRSAHSNPYVGKWQRLFLATLAHGSVIPLIICGVSLILSRGGGLYWLVAGVLISFFAVFLDAWVLLIEILR
jgi:hypothetical protein